MKSPAKSGELDGTISLESGSVSARVTFLPGVRGVYPVAVALSA